MIAATSTEQPMRVLHVITGLRLGGAETALVRLLERSDQRRFTHHIVALAELGPLSEGLQAAGLEVAALGLASGWSAPRAACRLARIVRRAPPELIVGWMYHGNLAALLAARMAPGRVPVVWNVRHTPPLDLAGEKRSRRWLLRLGSRLASNVAMTVYNSRASADRHADLGYPRAASAVIENGFDTDVFRPHAAAAEALRQRLGVDPRCRLIGRIGRYHPVKDYPSFLRAGASICRRHRAAHLVLGGPQVDPANAELVAAVAAAGLEDRAHLLGSVDDMPALLAGLDVVCSSSLGESCPNVVGEAMACGVPCVVTDVGGSASLVGDAGTVVPPADPAALAAAVIDLLDLEPAARAALGLAARERIERHFAARGSRERHETIWHQAIPSRVVSTAARQLPSPLP